MTEMQTRKLACTEDLQCRRSCSRGRKNQMNPSCLEHAFMIWFRSANSHTGPQLHRCIRGRTDGSIRLRADILQKPLAFAGRMTPRGALVLTLDQIQSETPQRSAEQPEQLKPLSF